jgi:hypothetical protein
MRVPDREVAAPMWHVVLCVVRCCVCCRHCVGTVKACRSDTSIESLSQNSELMLQTSARQRKRIEVKSLEALKARLTRRLSGNAAPVEKSPEPMVPKLDIVQDATFTICTDLRDFSHIQRDIDRLHQTHCASKRM